MQEITVPEGNPSDLPATISQIEQALQVASTADQVNKLLAIAESACAFASRYYQPQADIVSKAREVMLRVKRRLGELLKAAPKSKGEQRHGPAVTERTAGNPPTLAEQGISKRLSSDAQKLADIPGEKFEEVAKGKSTIKAAVAASTPVDSRPAKPDPIAKLKTRVAELEAEIEELKTFLAGAEDAAEQAVQTAANLQSVADGEEAKRLEVLSAKLRASEARKSELMNENAQLKRQIKAMQRAEKRAA